MPEEIPELKTIGRRFKLISISLLAICYCSYLTSIVVDHKTFTNVTLFIGIFFGMWMFADYKMLRLKRYYILSLVLAISFVIFGLLTESIFLNTNIKRINLGIIFPISLLILQLPFRMAFNLLLDREPVVDHPPPTFPDLIYSYLLFFSSIVIPALIFK